MMLNMEVMATHDIEDIALVKFLAFDPVCNYLGHLRRVELLQVTHDISHLSCADVFRAAGVQTPVIVRFSTVIHERGSPETLRDPRGFAVKFYTRLISRSACT